MTQMEIIHCKEKPKQEEGTGPTTPTIETTPLPLETINP
jgi:hypothetical protein